MEDRAVVLSEHAASTLTVRDLAKELSKAKLSCAVVLRPDETVLGIVTEQDLVRKFQRSNNKASKSLSRDDDGEQQTVLDVMTKRPICLTSNHLVKEDDNTGWAALELMAQKSFRHVPMVNVDGKYKGCVDIVSAIGPELLQKLAVPAGKLLRMRFSHVAVYKSTSGKKAAAYMSKYKQSALVVVNNGRQKKLIGIITESDLTRKVLATGLELDQVVVSQVMTPKPFTVQADADPVTCLRQMIGRGFRHLPIVDKRGRVVSVLDILTLVKISHESLKKYKAIHQKNKSQKDFSKDDVEKTVSDELDDTVPAGSRTSPKDSEEAQAKENVSAPDEEQRQLDIVNNEEEELEEDEEEQEEGEGEGEGKELEKHHQPQHEVVEVEKQAMESIVRGNFDAAIVLFSEALEKMQGNPTALRLYLRRGNVLSCVGKLEEALKDLNHVVEQAVDNQNLRVEAIVGVCEILVETGRYEAASRQIRKDLLWEQAQDLVQQLNGEMQKFKDLGKDLFMQSDFSGAIVAYTNAVRVLSAVVRIEKDTLSPQEGGPRSEPVDREDDVLVHGSKEHREALAILLSNRAACYQSVRDFKYALGDAQSAVKLNPGYEKAWVRLCRCLYDLDKYDKCAQALQQARLSLGSKISGPILSKLESMEESCRQKEELRKSCNLDAIKSLGKALASAVNVSQEEAENQRANNQA